MNQLKHLLNTVCYSILCFIFITSTIFIACNPDKDGKGSTTITTAPDPEAKNLYGQYLDTLKLSSTDYTILRNTFPSSGSQRSKLVFQFYFNTSNGSTPSMIAYASKPGNQFTAGAVTTPVSKILVKGKPHTFQLPDEFVLGDQQISFDALDGLIGTSTNYTLLFIPEIESGTKNVRYFVCIDKGSGPSCPAPAPPTQPSPPANAS